MERVAPFTQDTPVKNFASCGAVPLTLAGENAQSTIVSVRGKDETRRHLSGLGFVEGAAVSVVTGHSGDLIVEVKGCRVALSRQMAQRIMVC